MGQGRRLDYLRALDHRGHHHVRRLHHRDLATAVGRANTPRLGDGGASVGAKWFVRLIANPAAARLKAAVTVRHSFQRRQKVGRSGNEAGILLTAMDVSYPCPILPPVIDFVMVNGLPHLWRSDRPLLGRHPMGPAYVPDRPSKGLAFPDITHMLYGASQPDKSQERHILDRIG